MRLPRGAILALVLFGAAAALGQDRNVSPDKVGKRPLPDLIDQLQKLKAGDAQMNAEMKALAEQLRKMPLQEQMKLLEKLTKSGKLTPPNGDFKLPDLPNVPPSNVPPPDITPPAVTPPNTTPPAVPPSQALPDQAVPPPETPKFPQGGMPPTPDGVPGFQPDLSPPGERPDVTGFQPNIPQSPSGDPDKRIADGLMNFWEKNVGPLDETPGLKNALVDFLKDGGLSDAGKSGLSELFESGKLDPNSLPKGDWFDKSSMLGSMKWPELGLKNFDFRMPETGLGGGLPSAPSMPSVSGGMDLPSGSALMPLLVLVAVAVAAGLVWKFWPQLQQLVGAQTDLREKTWPFDPRAVADRAALVRAFEFLSVTLCGNAARVWNHKTIATALRTKVVGADVVADELAALYELARYTPPDEPISDDQLAAARRCLCHLAGVNPA